MAASRFQRLTMGLLVVGAMLASRQALAAPSFRQDVMAILSKAGCNAGVCHGNFQGKGGFRLSLRGEAPAADWAAITRDQASRRINQGQPDQSLVLKKPTLAVAHEGGRRFNNQSAEYGVLRDWIAGGAIDDVASASPVIRIEATPSEAVLFEPAREQALRVVAHFADGTSRDVTQAAVYEPASPLATVSPDGLVSIAGFGETTVLVRYLEAQSVVSLAHAPARPDFAYAAPSPQNWIDDLIFARLRSLRVNPAQLCDDRAFLRRAFLDLIGRYPTTDEARRFLNDGSVDKRGLLVDDLLAREEYAEFWALKWCDLLRVEEKTLDRKGVAAMHHWLTRSLAEGASLAGLAREIVAAEGSTYRQPATNFYRAHRDPLSRAEAVAQVFLGTRLACAKCHNHPFDRWRQDDYYDWAATFSGIEYKIVSNRRRDDNDKHEFDGEQIVHASRKSMLKNPRTGEQALPRPLGADKPIAAAQRLEATSRWLSQDNSQFARAQANRIWAHLLGRGIVEPVDDFRQSNPPSHPELLDRLASELAAHGYDQRWLIRLIAGSATYQLAARDNTSVGESLGRFASGEPRRLSAEQLLDSIAQLAGAPVKFNGYPLGLAAREIPGVQAVRPREQRPSPADQFLASFGRPPRLLNCDCERSDESTLNQAFQMISGELVNRLLAARGNRFDQALADNLTDYELVDALYWEALSRDPSTEERAACVELLTTAQVRRAALEDIAWGLANSTEYLLRP